ncbi:MAG TPA: dihydrolipoamide acetyltransferase family protein [Streptosporangiaceae bacterium]|jgi:pyruvate dehydrogenase E2 component (dihydrolipoamide acetyltransferase)
MSMEFRLPDVGSGIADAEIIEWRVGVGDQVREGDILVTVETSKSIVEMPSPAAGTIARLGASPGESLTVGAVLAVLDGPTGDSAAPAGAGQNAYQVEEPAPDAPSAPSEPAAPAAQSPAAQPPAAQSPAAQPPAGHSAAQSPAAQPLPGGAARPKASPVVRRIALQRGIDLRTIAGTGPAGRITRGDIESVAAPDAAAPALQPPAAPQPPAPAWRDPAAGPPEDERVPVRGLRRQVAKAMAESWRTIPHIVDWREADATRLIEARQALRAARPEQAAALTFVPFFVKITAIALRQHPLMNASFDEAAGEYTLHGRINIGVATAVTDGVIVPVVPDADRKSLLELAGEIADLVRLARERKVTPGQLAGGSYTVNNLGGIGAQVGTPIIRMPEVGILGFGRVTERVVAAGGRPVVRPSVMLSSVADHRLHDGATLGAFTAAVVELIENPYLLLAELR